MLSRAYCAPAPRLRCNICSGGGGLAGKNPPCRSRCAGASGGKESSCPVRCCCRNRCAGASGGQESSAPCAAAAATVAQVPAAGKNPLPRALLLPQPLRRCQRRARILCPVHCCCRNRCAGASGGQESSAPCTAAAAATVAQVLRRRLLLRGRTPCCPPASKGYQRRFGSAVSSPTVHGSQRELRAGRRLGWRELRRSGGGGGGHEQLRAKISRNQTFTHPTHQPIDPISHLPNTHPPPSHLQTSQSHRISANLSGDGGGDRARTKVPSMCRRQHPTAQGLVLRKQKPCRCCFTKQTPRRCLYLVFSSKVYPSQLDGRLERCTPPNSTAVLSAATIAFSAYASSSTSARPRSTYAFRSLGEIVNSDAQSRCGTSLCRHRPTPSASWTPSPNFGFAEEWPRNAGLSPMTTSCATAVPCCYGESLRPICFACLVWRGV